MVANSIMDDPQSCAKIVYEMIAWLAVVPCAWGKYRDIASTYLTLDNQVLLQMFHQDILAAANPRVLSKKDICFVYTTSKQMDIYLVDIMFAKKVACLKNLWRIMPRYGRVSFEGPFVFRSLFYQMLEQQGMPIV